jgi:hypothetical protein
MVHYLKIELVHFLQITGSKSKLQENKSNHILYTILFEGNIQEITKAIQWLTNW